MIDLSSLYLFVRQHSLIYGVVIDQCLFPIGESFLV